MNHYVTLGISMNADEETIRHAFRTLARRYHPDAGSGSSVEKFRNVFEAYETLRDPLRRAAYDHSLRVTRRSTGAIRVESLRAEPLRAEPLQRSRPHHSAYIEEFFFGGDADQLFDELFNILGDDPFFWRPGR
jgi:DnaJ-class molecular chaperone